jgi:hypothetical protein
MMTTTGFHRRTRPFTKDFPCTDFVASDFASCFAAATGGIDGEVAGRAIAAVTRGLTIVATGQEFQTGLRTEGDWVCARCPVGEVCDGGLAAGTMLYGLGGAGTGCCFGVLGMAFLFA